MWDIFSHTFSTHSSQTYHYLMESVQTMISQNEDLSNVHIFKSSIMLWNRWCLKDEMKLCRGFDLIAREKEKEKNSCYFLVKTISRSNSDLVLEIWDVFYRQKMSETICAKKEIHAMNTEWAIIIGLLIFTLNFEKQGLEKLRPVSNLRKISGPAHLDFFRLMI